MLMYLSILDTQDEKEKFTEVYEQYQHFCWYVAKCWATIIWRRTPYRRPFWR